MAVKWKWQYAHREPIDRSRSPKWGPEGAAFWVGKRENGNFWPAYGVRAELKDPKKKKNCSAGTGSGASRLPASNCFDDSLS